MLVLLTVILTPVVILASWNDGDDGRWSANAFFAWMLALEGLAIGVFAATDVFLFYVLLRGDADPDLLPDRRVRRSATASVRRGEVPAVLAVRRAAHAGLGVGLYVESAEDRRRADVPVSELAEIDIGTDAGRWLFLGFFIAFAIKAPMLPVHTWLPDTTESATPGTSVLLVSVLDKIGTFGMIRFCLEHLPRGVAVGHAGGRRARDLQHPVRRADGDRLRTTSPG